MIPSPKSLEVQILPTLDSELQVDVHPIGVVSGGAKDAGLRNLEVFRASRTGGNAMKSWQIRVDVDG